MKNFLIWLEDIVDAHTESGSFMEAGRAVEKVIDRYHVTIISLLNEKKNENFLQIKK